MTHSLLRKRRAAAVTVMAAAAVTVGLAIAPVTTHAEPRPAHAPTANADTTPSPGLVAACPVDGAASFEDSWGWPRSGGRSHQGVDMIADRGTPVVAVRDGDAVFKNNRLGGNAVWLTTPNDDKFYYAHLDSFEGESRTVQVGDLLGYVGSTGNAGGPHLHFETLPGGIVENPFPHTHAACTPTPAELEAIAAHQANALNDPAIWQRFLPSS